MKTSQPIDHRQRSFRLQSASPAAPFAGLIREHRQTIITMLAKLFSDYRNHAQRKEWSSCQAQKK
jgi:hypothetical protein